jgi:hypothetical protein
MKFTSFIFCLLVFLNPLKGQFSADLIEAALMDMEGVRFVKMPSEEGQKYELSIRQPVDHKNPNGPYFYQRVIFSHMDFNTPVVMNTNGYNLRDRKIEPVDMLGANYLNIEHRYFGESIPEVMDWQYLNLYNVTADLHHINQLFKKIYTGTWVSSGVSKGGQTTIYYRYFYPDDVDLSIPYVAPVNKSINDSRIYDFLDTVGSKVCRDQVRATQIEFLKNKKEILEKLKWHSKGAGYSFNYFGDMEKAFELAVLEYPFSFWQSGLDCGTFPDPKGVDALTDYFISAVGLSLYSDNLVSLYGPHYYQAATEMGYYHLETEGLEQWLDKVGDDPSAAFEPKGVSVTYEPATNERVHQWLMNTKENMIFIYGEYDTWSATRAVTHEGNNILYIIVEKEDHGGARISNFSADQRNQLNEYLKQNINFTTKQ